MKITLCALLVSVTFVHAQNATTNSTTPVSRASLRKRGLIYVWPQKDEFWDSDRSPLTWYYNYQSYPTYGIDGDKLEFVPMMWGNRQEDQGTCYLVSFDRPTSDQCWRATQRTGIVD